MDGKDSPEEQPSATKDYPLIAEPGIYTVTGAPARLESPLTDDHLRAIGRISVNFSRLEFGMRLCINHLLGVGQEEGLIATAQLGFRQLTTVLHQLYRHKYESDGGQLTKIDALAGRIVQASIARDTVIHSTWLLSVDGEAMGIKVPRSSKWFSPTISMKTPSDLEAVAKTIQDVADEVAGLIIEATEAPK